MMFQVRMVYRTWKSGTPTGRFVLRHKPEIISHKKLRHILAGEEAVTDLGGGDVHYGSVYDLYVVGAEEGFLKASHSVWDNLFGIKDIGCGEILALLDQLTLDAVHVVAFARIDSHTIFRKNSRKISPAADALKVVGADDKREVVVRLPLLERVKSPDRVVRRIHPELDIVH